MGGWGLLGAPCLGWVWQCIPTTWACSTRVCHHNSLPVGSPARGPNPRFAYVAGPKGGAAGALGRPGMGGKEHGATMWGGPKRQMRHHGPQGGGLGLVECPTGLGYPLSDCEGKGGVTPLGALGPIGGAYAGCAPPLS